MVKRLLKIPNRIFLKLLRSSLALLEQAQRKFTPKNIIEVYYPPIFIIGPPRSGTTLLYQLMVHHFHLAYFSGIANGLYTSPVLATKWGLKHYKPYVSDFTSNYGKINDPIAPHEAGEIWNRWYPTEYGHGYNYTPAGCFDAKTKHIIYQTVADVERLFGAPFINKNVKHSVRVQSLVEIFPKALFLQIKRDVFNVANSILRGRKQNHGNIDAWFSVMPEWRGLKQKVVSSSHVITVFQRVYPNDK